MVAALAAMTMNAQVYLGGQVSFQSVDNGSTTSLWVVNPEIGYVLDENSAIGISLGYGELDKDKLGTAKVLTVNPYYRYTLAKFDKVSLFIDGGFDFTQLKYKTYKNNTWSVGVKPGVALNLNDKLSFVSHFGFLGYQNSKDDTTGAVATKTYGATIDATNIKFGLYYNF